MNELAVLLYGIHNPSIVTAKTCNGNDLPEPS